MLHEITDTRDAAARRHDSRDANVLERAIDALVIERQALREGAAPRRVLERNRRALVALERELSRTLIDQHLPDVDPGIAA